MNNKGYLSVEAAIVVPMMLIGTCLLLAFFLVLFKWSSFELIYNHHLMAEDLDLKAHYGFEQLSDKNTRLDCDIKRQSFLGVIKKEESANMRLYVPFIGQNKSIDVENSRYEISTLYKITLGDFLIPFLEKLRDE